MGIDWRTIRAMSGKETYVNSGVYIGPTQGLSSPKNNRRSCLCLHSNTYSRKCCNGALIEQGVGSITGNYDYAARGPFNIGFSNGFDIGTPIQ